MSVLAGTTHNHKLWGLRLPFATIIFSYDYLLLRISFPTIITLYAFQTLIFNSAEFCFFHLAMNHNETKRRER